MHGNFSTSLQLVDELDLSRLGNSIFFGNGALLFIDVFIELEFTNDFEILFWGRLDVGEMKVVRHFISFLINSLLHTQVIRPSGPI